MVILVNKKSLLLFFGTNCSVFLLNFFFDWMLTSEGYLLSECIKHESAFFSSINFLWNETLVLSLFCHACSLVLFMMTECEQIEPVRFKDGGCHLADGCACARVHAPVSLLFLCCFGLDFWFSFLSCWWYMRQLFSFFSREYCLRLFKISNTFLGSVIVCVCDWPAKENWAVWMAKKSLNTNWERN